MFFTCQKPYKNKWNILQLRMRRAAMPKAVCTYHLRRAASNHICRPLPPLWNEMEPCQNLGRAAWPNQFSWPVRQLGKHFQIDGFGCFSSCGAANKCCRCHDLHAPISDSPWQSLSQSHRSHKPTVSLAQPCQPKRRDTYHLV